MNHLFFFLKLQIKKPVFILAAVLLFALSVFSVSASSVKEKLPCAVCSEDDSKEAESVVSELTNAGFLLCASEEEVKERVKNGTADTGLVIEKGFSEKLKEDDLDGCAMLYTSQRSQYSAEYKLISAAAIYRELMPYKAADLAEKMGVETDYEEVASYEEEASSMTNKLEFNIVSIEGEIIEEQKNTGLSTGVLSVSVFVIFGMIAVTLINKNSKPVRLRFDSGGRFFSSCLLPQCASAGILFYAAVTAGILFSRAILPSAGNLIMNLPSFAAYMAVLVILFSVLCLLPVNSNILICVIALDAAFSLIACPLYEGLSVLIRLGWLKVLSVPYFVFLFGAA